MQTLCVFLWKETVIYLHLNYHDETNALAKDIQRWVAILEYNAFFFLSRKTVDSTEKLDSYMMADKAHWNLGRGLINCFWK